MHDTHNPHPTDGFFRRRLPPLSLLLLVCHLTQAQPAPNKVANPGFEEGLSGWALQNHAAAASAVIDETVSHSGKRSLRLTNASPPQPNVYYRASQTLATQPFTTYRISCWVKGEDSGTVFIGGGLGWKLRKALPEGTFDWQEVSVEWSTGANAEDFELILLTQSPTKACWIDDVRFVAIHTDEAKVAELSKSLGAGLQAQRQHLQRVTALAQQRGEANNAYARLGLSVARRFLDRIDVLGLKQNMSWSTLQLEEIDTVLTETEGRLRNDARTLPGKSAFPDDGPVEIRNGVFYSGHAGTNPPAPAYFGGYGAFGAVFHDLPAFRDYGVTLIQDGRRGPSSLGENGTSFDNAKLLVDDLRTANQHGVKIDLLLSPHYFPEWAYKQAPDLRNGNIGFLNYNIDHPKARQVIEQWLRAVVPVVKDQPALFSYCLSNEPAYVQSGKDPYSRPKWVKYLQDVHGDIAALNALYGTSYKGFEDVVVPTRFDMPKQLDERRAYSDWCRFNQVNFADWHRWMNGIIKSIDPNARTHVKLFSNHTFNRGLIRIGVDPELFCEFTDIAGCDNYVRGAATLTSWPGADLYYDLLNSFRNQPVFNSETHFIPDGFPPQHIPWENSRAVMWQGALHHLGASTIWVWEEPGPGGLLGSIYLRPANIFGVGRALLDANRLSNEVTAINQARPRVALLYSQPSIFWEKDYPAAVANVYQQLKFAGEKVTFVSERQLAAGRAPKVDVIISPRATHVAAKTLEGLRQFVAGGGKLILCGDDDLHFDPYHREQALPTELQKSLRLKLGPNAKMELIPILRKAGIETHPLESAADRTAVTGVEYRTVDYDGGTLVPLINLTGAILKVRLPDTVEGKAQDLLTGRQMDRDAIELRPMVPLLLRCTH